MKPYDEYVMKSLLVLRHYLPSGFTLSSDGGFDEEWQAARDWCEAYFGVGTYTRHELMVG